MSSTATYRDHSLDRVALEKGLPANIDAERFILGSVLLEMPGFIEIAGIDYATTTSRSKSTAASSRACRSCTSAARRSTASPSPTSCCGYNELESVDGLSYLVSLDDGLPHIANLDSYVKIVRDKATLRRIAMASQHMMNRALLAEEDPGTILAGAEETLLKLGEARSRTGLMTPLEVIQNYEGGLNAFLDPSKRIKGISTGFTKLDEMTGGLHSGELIILAARPSMGKTAFALNIAWHVATRLFQPVAVFSLEMSQESLLTRMLCAAARVDSAALPHRLPERAGAPEAAPGGEPDGGGAPLHRRHGGREPDGYARQAAAAEAIGQKLGLVVVDYLQLMSAPGRSENRNQEVSQISRGLKLLSKELDCPFLVLSQLSRATETRQGDHRPQLSDLRESGSIEQDADLVGFIFREEVYKRDREDLHGVAELILAKQSNGPIGKVELVFLHAQTRFENRAEDLGDSASGVGGRGRVLEWRSSPAAR